MVLVPASMELLGDWNWYFLSWLEWLPRIQIEGAAPVCPATEIERPGPVGTPVVQFDAASGGGS